MCAPVLFTTAFPAMSATTAATLSAVSTVGLIAGTTMMSVNAQKQQLAYQRQQAEFQRKQYQMQAQAADLETLQLENDRKRKYLNQLSSNRALLTKMNITTDSPSYRAFLKANQETVKKDLTRLKLQGKEKQLAALYGVQQADISRGAAGAAYKAGVATTVGRSLLAARPILGELS